MSAEFRLVGVDEAINDRGVRIFIPPSSPSKVRYELAAQAFSLPFEPQFICDGTILVYLFCLPEKLYWEGTSSALSESEKEQVSDELIEAFALFGALGVRFDESDLAPLPEDSEEATL